MTAPNFPEMAAMAEGDTARWQGVADLPSTGEHEATAARHTYTAHAAVAHAARLAGRMGQEGNTTAQVAVHARDSTGWCHTVGEELLAAQAVERDHPSELATEAAAAAKDAGRMAALILGYTKGFITAHFEQTGEMP